MKAIIPTVVLVIGLLGASVFAADTKGETGTVRGVVFTADADGGRSIVPGAKISLIGPATRETEADAAGKYVFDALPPGSYKLKAQAPGMIAIHTVVIAVGAVSEAPLEMKVDVVSESTTVTATADALGTEEPAGNNTVGGSAVNNVPNLNERFEGLLPLLPGVVRGPDGVINMNGARSSQSGSLVNSADVSDPATGATAINIPIDVVSSVQVFSTPYDPEYGRFTGAVSDVETRPGDFNKFHTSVQHLLPRFRRLNGSIMGLASVTPRVTFTGPILKDRIAFTQSFDYRFERTPVNSLPPLQSDTKLESFDSYTQLDLKINQKQTATASFALFPQKLDYFGLNTFTPQESTPNLHERGYQTYVQHRYLTGAGNLLTSQMSFRRFDADVLPNSAAPYELLVETTEGGFFNRQQRNTSRVEWQEILQSHPHQLHGSHELRAGIDFAHSSYDGHEQFLPVEIAGVAGYPLQRIQFGPFSNFSVDQNETAWFVGDKWTLSNQLTFDLGLRFDQDSVTGSVNTAPRAGFGLALTSDGKTVLKGGAGLFFDRVPLDIPAFPHLPGRTVVGLNPFGRTLTSTAYVNVISGGLRNPRSEVWNLELDRKILNHLLVRVAYQQRNTVRDFVLTPLTFGPTGVLSLANRGSDFYREFQVTGRYQMGHTTLNASYVRSRAFGDLNDFNQFFGNNPQAVIQPNQRGRLPFDAPNRFLAWAEIAGPWKLTLAPALDAHTGFPYSLVNQSREFVGPRNERQFPRFIATDFQISRRIPLPIKERHAVIGFAVFNVFNRSNPRDVQNDIDSYRFNEFFNGVSRTFRGKFVLEF
jgi:outer membrane receptor protein involved in Fe transport